MPIKFPPDHHEPEPTVVLANSILLLAREVGFSNQLRKQELDFFKSLSQFATKDDLNNLGNKIMSAITDFAAAMKTFTDEQSADIDKILVSITDIDGDVASLNAKIQALIDSAGSLSDEDKAALASVLTDSSALATKTANAVTVAQALDDKTPPVVPTP